MSRKQALPGGTMMPWPGWTILTDDEAFVAEVGDDLHPAAEGTDVGGEGPQFAGVHFGAFDGGDPFLPYLHPFGYLGLGQPEALAHLCQSVGTVDIDREYQAVHCPVLSPATNRTALRAGSKINKILISVLPADPGRNSFKLCRAEPLIRSTSGRPRLGPSSSSAVIAWPTRMALAFDHPRWHVASPFAPATVRPALQ
jgi:hypothetical protein